MSWGRVNHPSEMLHIGQSLEVVILEVDREKERVSLGLKQMTDNPWADIERKYPINSHVKGRVTKLLPYGAFVELEKGVEGLVHVSELSWVKRITRPSDVLKLDQEIEAVVLSISVKEQKISLGVRQLEDNPWADIESRFPIGTVIKGQVRNLTPYGAFCGTGRRHRRHDPRVRYELDPQDQSSLRSSQEGRRSGSHRFGNQEGGSARLPWYQAA